MRVILVRHAEAAPGRPDELRQLTPAGREAAASLAAILAEMAPSAVVTSPLARARETATAIAAAAGLEPVADVRLAPGATTESLRAAVEGHGDSVIAVGHQPDLGLIYLDLTGRETRFPPAAYAEVDL